MRDLISEYQKRHLAETGYEVIDPYSSIRHATHTARKLRAKRAAAALQSTVNPDGTEVDKAQRGLCECGEKATERAYFRIGNGHETSMKVCASCYMEMKREDEGVW
jgi:hypothetical protein